MLEANQIKARLANVLAGSESVSVFADWLSKESASLRLEDTDLLNLADSILSPIQAYFDDLISESQLKRELGQFVADDVQWVTMHFVFEGTHFIFDSVSPHSVQPDLEPSMNPQSQLDLAKASFAMSG